MNSNTIYPAPAPSSAPSKMKQLLASMEADDGLVMPPHPLQPSRLADMRIQEMNMNAGVPVRSAQIGKPSPQTWFRTLGDERDWSTFYTFSPEGETNTIYFVSPEVAGQLGSVVRAKRLVPYVTLHALIGFWPITVSDRPNSWNDSAREIAGGARTEWRRMTSNMRTKSYESARPAEPKPEPAQVSREELEALLEKASTGKWILDLHHPAVRGLF